MHMHIYTPYIPTYIHTHTYTCENAHATDIHKQKKRRRRARKDLLKKKSIRNTGNEQCDE